mmetsp:Transcript_86948/g.246495  ORF Transcript_86948/g.246495 Transcript_86948/m.246495 type:complete len:218 (+) Transcript_86948:798-1451(+)
MTTCTGSLTASARIEDMKLPLSSGDEMFVSTAVGTPSVMITRKTGCMKRSSLVFCSSSMRSWSSFRQCTSGVTPRGRLAWSMSFSILICGCTSPRASSMRTYATPSRSGRGPGFSSMNSQGVPICTLAKACDRAQRFISSHLVQLWTRTSPFGAVSKYLPSYAIVEAELSRMKNLILIGPSSLSRTFASPGGIPSDARRCHLSSRDPPPVGVATTSL